MSERLAAEIDRSAEADKQGALKLSQGAYVERDVEAAILRRLGSGEVETEIVVGEAGDGKTTLLWSLHRKLSGHSHPILLSAVWFQPDDHGHQALTPDAVVDAVAGTADVVVLLDTADLLLHSEFTTQQTVALLERLTDLGVQTVIATRPREALSLPADLGRRTDLTAYSDDELAAAVPKLVQSYCPANTETPTDATAALKQARARGLVVDRVCSSPLLLRLMFELATPRFPRLEIDVTGLYRQYWDHRVVADLRARSGRALRQKGTDLSTDAGLIGIVMVAAGRPEVKVESAIRRATEAASNAGLHIGNGEIRTAIDTLCQRGVLIESAGSIRFLHQTLFEFAAAQGLANRGCERELPRLLDRLEGAPDDLFLGAVIEQLLILLADDELSQDAVAEAVRRLSRTKQPSLVEIAMMVWAHHPALPGVDPEYLESVHPEAIDRFIRVVPGVHSSADDIIDHLVWIWDHRQPLRPKVVDACAYLARRSPSQVAAFVASQDVIGELAERHRKMVRANATPLLLLDAMLVADPDYARPAAIDLIDKLASDAEGKATIANCLRLIAVRWAAAGSAAFLAEVENTVESIQSRSNDSDAKLVREALSEVIAQHWIQLTDQLPADARTDNWLQQIQELCIALEDIPVRTPKSAGDDDTDNAGEAEDSAAMRGDQSPVLGARLIAVARVVATIDPNDPRVVGTLDQLFDLKGPAATRQLARGSIAYLLINHYPATAEVIDRLGARLAACLPADYNAFEPGAELWAAVARSCLMDSRIPAAHVAAVTAQARGRYPDSVPLWTRRDMLLGLAPAAIAAGDPDATRVYARIRDQDLELPDTETNIFLDNATDRVEQEPELLAPLMIHLAHRVGRSAIIRTLADIDSVQPALREHTSSIIEWIGQLLSGPDRSQGDGARLLLKLATYGIVRADFEQLVALYPRLTHPEAKADVVRTIGRVTLKTMRNDDAIQFLRTLVRTKRDPTPTIRAAPGPRLANPVIVDAARDALLEAFGFQTAPSPSDWDTVFSLTFAPRLSGSRAVDMTGAGNLSLYLTHLVDAGYVPEASRYLCEVIDTLAPITSRQARLGSNRLRVAIGTIVRRASRQDLHGLLEKVEQAPEALSSLMIWAAVRERYDDTRTSIDRLAEHPTLGHEVTKALINRVRIAGRQTFAEVLTPV
ncbi:NACHT domain-containing protein [Mycobacterium pinniadriaticum]|uniref:ATP-binding protein n=2 Tax=Mycobacterium pinniadriaticum TaxID=2994102 RepID=A0ABT3SNH0_9MYCO|nr:ATP-binding protein [Mycobacterium pinniadriaticum]MCX2941085.1 ATP-binding protein [Mycobacterium pinniadriaticum]